MKSQFILFLLLVTLSPISFAGSSLANLPERAKESLSRNPAFEMVSVNEFWGDASFLKDCAPPNSQVAAPFTIYFEVLSNGQLGVLHFEPLTPVASCIKQHVSKREFSKPPGGVPYVTNIDMKFQQ